MIKVLDKHVADKIAAGEVIDRPVSIIKELVENSLDAGAGTITVEIRNGGKSYIRVTDNGCGIAGEEVEIAFRRHATSKITVAEDLNAIHTLGFRGEALASICAVARVELVTKTLDAKAGRRVVLEGSNIIENSTIGCPDGTTITVRDLFYNVPARSKFMASDSAETRRIIDMVSRIALSYPDVKFTLINGNSTVFATAGKGNILNSIISIFGADIGKDLIPVEDSLNGFVIKGFVSSPSSSSPSRSKQIFCINGRVVSSDILEKALDEAYREKLFHGRFPIAFLFLALPPEKLDVNVHPTKREIRFDDPYEISDFVIRSVKSALTVKEAVPHITTENVNTKPVKLFVAPEQGVQETIVKSIPVEPPVSGTPSNYNVKKTLSSKRESENLSAGPEITKPLVRPFDFENLTILGALFNTYIVAYDEDSFYLIDQHAAHERVFYERLLEQYNSKEKLRQTLIIPLNFNVSKEVVSFESEWIDRIRSIGYDIDFFGNNTYLVREIPAFMDIDEAEAFLKDMFSTLEDKPDLTNTGILEKIITRSCKSAVKGGDSLSKNERDALMKDLKNCVNPFSCPHGRPTFIRMTRHEIEKLFKRV